MLFTAAFLTQTVTLDNQTTVKFEIWCALVLTPFHFHVLHPNRDTAGQERYKASLPQLSLIMRLTFYSLSYVLAIVFAFSDIPFIYCCRPPCTTGTPIVQW